MLMLADREIPSTFEGDELRSFLKTHIEFFSADFDLHRPDRINVEILWPRIDEYLTVWLETKRSDPWAAGHEMVRTLKTAGIEPPEWPRATKDPPAPRKILKGLDDEIPF